MAQSFTRRTFLSLSAASLMATRLAAAEPSGIVYIGSTTRKPGDGIHVARWNARSGTLSDVRVAFEAISPSFLAVSRHRKTPLLFAGYQTAPKTGGLSSFRIAASGDLELLNTLPADDADFVHLAVDHTDRCLVTVNYGKGDILSSKVGPDGHLSAFVSHIQLTGHGPNSQRQASPHAHGVAFAPNNHFVYVNDLGTDRILIYRFDAATAQLTANDPPFFSAAPGAGPRHLLFHPNGRWAYTINELNSTVTFFHWDSVSGALTSVANVPTLATGGDVANNRAGELAFDAAGHFLYACNRGPAEELVTYAVGPEGRLTLRGRIQTAGKEARDFLVSPDNGFVVATEQFSNQVAVFARNRQTGLLTPTDALCPVDSPSCLLFC